MTWFQHVCFVRFPLITVALLFSFVLAATARMGFSQIISGERDVSPQIRSMLAPLSAAGDEEGQSARNVHRVAASPSSQRGSELLPHHPVNRLPDVDEPTTTVGLPAPPNGPLFPAPSIEFNSHDKKSPSGPLHDEDDSADEWWRPLVVQPQWPTSQPLPVTLDQLIASTLQYSDQVKVFSDSPLIRDLTIIEEDAEFDWVGFSETMWNDVDEPVGNTLTTGGPTRFKNERWESRYGLRRRSTSGGRFEIYEEINRENSNSIFFLPNDQGTSQLTISYSQPVLRGAGRVYNSSLIVLAQIDASAARDEFSRQLQTQLLDVSDAYWSLFQLRAELMQKERLLKDGQDIFEELRHRAEVDASGIQIGRAETAVAVRTVVVIRARMLVKNAESRIRSLVNAPQLGVADQFELLPLDAPSVQFIPVSMSDALALAIRNRPELHQAVKRIKAASVRCKMSKNELLPALDLVLETYVRGIRGNYNVGGAFKDSFSNGAPSYSAGIQMEFPLGNRAARATVRRRSIEMRQLQSQFRATVDALQLETEVVVREIQTAYVETKASYQAMKSAEREVHHLTKRWQLLSGGEYDPSAALFLEDLLAAQDRRAITEQAFVQSQIVYNQSLTRLKQVTGTLLQMEQIHLQTASGPDGNPELLPVKAGPASATLAQ